jgi:NADPH-dependent 2,4-dienoyl-CoA reductase/sulfur reductase-like enzyme
LRLGESVTGFETDDDRVSAVVTDQATVRADLVILGLGVEPNTTLAQDAGIQLGQAR